MNQVAAISMLGNVFIFIVVLYFIYKMIQYIRLK
ncbi:hypothetical protein BW42_00988 [Exiguobacterium sp. RIT341]|nr:hypothetical protein BW42_00988 [Exiguobacterium sp. RIT341]